MAWFIGQSLVIIAVAFLLGLLVGWLIWGRLLRRRSAESSLDSAAAVGLAVVAPAVAAPAEDLAPKSVVAAERPPEPSPEPEPEPPSEPEPEPVTAAEADREGEAGAEREGEPAAVVGAEGDGASAVVIPVQADGRAEPDDYDDLERIEGIGPQMSGALQVAGIRTYVQLASADEGTLRAAIKARGLRFAPSLVTWGRQAQLLADGDEEGFADLTRRLVAGRDEGRE